MDPLPVVAVLALCIAQGCAQILQPILEFLREQRGPVGDKAAAPLLLALPMLYFANVVFAHFAGVTLAYLHLAPAPAADAVPAADLRRFAALVFTLVSALLLLNAVLFTVYSAFERR